MTPYRSTEGVCDQRKNKVMRAGLTISRAAERAGVGVETIRFYERRGLINQLPRPRGGGCRFYDDSIVERIRFMREAQELGFSLREIKELLSLQADPAARRLAFSEQDRLKICMYLSIILATDLM